MLALPALALALFAAPVAADDLVPCEMRGEMNLDRDGRQVQANFLGACGDVEDYDKALAVQVEEDDGSWTVIGTHWEVVDSEELEFDGEWTTYRRFEQLVACPGAGPYEFRVAWINPDGAEAWFGDRLDCERRGSSCSSAPRRPSTWLTLLAVFATLLSATRRRCLGL